MKKLMQLCLIGLLSVSLFGCFGSNDEKDAKKLVTSYLDLLGKGDLEGIVELTGDETDLNEINQGESFKKSVKLMVEKLDYTIEETTVDETSAVITVKVSNINFTDLRLKALAKMEEEVENLDELSLEEQETKLLETIERLLPEEMVNEQTVDVYLEKSGDSWKFTQANADFFTAALGY